MKRFFKAIDCSLLLVPLVLALLPTQRATACAFEGYTYNNYLFSVFHRDLMGNPFSDRTDAFWQEYVGKDVKMYNYLWSDDKIMEVARQRGDTEMMAYLRLLNAYIKASSIFDGWDYPTKADLGRRDSTLRQQLAQAGRYRGSRLRGQYALLTMRALFGLNMHPVVITYWRKTGSQLHPSVYRDMMRNLYAGALLRTGHKAEAVEIYAEQEDYASLQYTVMKYRNVAGIKATYRDNPNSALLTYLVQDFVNNTQESYDCQFDDKGPRLPTPGDSTCVDWLQEMGARVVYQPDAEEFIAFARSVVKEGKTACPCLWQSAIGCIEHQLGRYAEAKADLKASLTMAGTPRMRDNARAIYAVNSVYIEPETAEYHAWLATELQWLDEMNARDKSGRAPYEPIYGTTSGHYRDVKDRLVFHGLIHKYTAMGNTNMVLSLLSMMQETTPGFDRAALLAPRDTSEGQYPYNPDYSGEYPEALQALSPEQTIAFFDYLRHRPSDKLAQLAWDKTYRNDDYYNDLIGTQLLARGRFDEAIGYLSKVSLDFLGTQNIVPYVRSASYEAERWFGHQQTTDESYNSHEPLTTNAKLDYCREVLRLQSLYRNMRPSDKRCETAYQLATMLYQATYDGDCWWLTQYGWSGTQDSIPKGYRDFMADAATLLDDAAKAKAFALKQKALYAAAFIRDDPWRFDGWDEATETWYDLDNLKPRPGSRQYRAMARLLDFAQANPDKVDRYVSTCYELNVFKRIVAQR